MKKKYIVKHNQDFEKIMQQGKCKKNRSYIIFSLQNDNPYDKYGISVSKKIGNAVIRNRYKRKIRSIIDNYKKNYINNKDYIIILRRGALDRTFQELEQDFLEII